MRRIFASCILASALAAVPAAATTTIYSVAYSGETAGMAGVANATEEDALSQAVNPANLTRIGSWRLDAGIGYLISRVTYDDDGVNPDEFGYFEYNEGHDFVVPGIAYARRVGKGPWVLGVAAYGNGGNAILYRNLGFNDTSGADLGGGVESFMVTGENAFAPLTSDNAVRRDNYATLQAGKVALTAAVELTPSLSLSFSPVLNIAILRFGTFGNFTTVGADTQVKGHPFAALGDTTTTYAQLFAAPTFPKTLMTAGDGSSRIAGVFAGLGSDPATLTQLVDNFAGAVQAGSGAISAAVAGLLESPATTQAFQDAFAGASGFGLSEVAGYAEGGGLSGFGYNTKLGLRWQVNDWLAIGGNYTQKATIALDNGTTHIDFSDQIRQTFNIGFRSAVAQGVLFSNMQNQFITQLEGLASQGLDEATLKAQIAGLFGAFADVNSGAVQGVIPDNAAINAGFGDLNIATQSASQLLTQFAGLLGYPDQASFLNAVGITQTPDGDPLSQQAVDGLLAASSWPDAGAFLQAFNGLAGQLDVSQAMDTQVDLDLPQQAGIGIEIKATPKLTVGMDFTWIDFSDAFQEFAARIEGSGQDTVIEKFLGLENAGDSFTFSQEFEWDDQYIIAIGGAYRATDALTLRLGYSHANNVVDAGNATPLFPAYGFETVSGGVTYALSDHTKLTAAWEHAFDERLRTAGNSRVDSQYDRADVTHGQDTIYLQYSLAY